MEAREIALLKLSAYFSTDRLFVACHVFLSSSILKSSILYCFMLLCVDMWAFLRRVEQLEFMHLPFALGNFEFSLSYFNCLNILGTVILNPVSDISVICIIS